MSRREVITTFSIRLLIISVGVLIASAIEEIPLNISIFFIALLVSEMISVVTLIVKQGKEDLRISEIVVNTWLPKETQQRAKAPEVKLVNVETEQFNGRTQIRYGIIGQTEEWDVWYEPVTDDMDAFVIRDKNTGEKVMTFPEDPFEDLQTKMDFFV